jgi:hypothetical protein
MRSGQAVSSLLERLLISPKTRALQRFEPLSHGTARLRRMAFGQQQGPPATARQVQELLALLQEAGHSDFRDARGPMGFTQRQAGGKFTRAEADAFVEQLRDQEPDSEQPPEVPIWRRSVQDDVLSQIPAERLAVELRRRGWTVLEAHT